MTTIKKNICIELGIIFAILFIFRLAGHEEGIAAFKLDSGSFICLVGILWAIGSVFRLNALIEGVVSLAFAIGTFLFGFGLYEKGIYFALLLTGLYIIILAYLTNPLAPTKSKDIFFIGFLLLIPGYCLRDYGMPTNPERYYHPITYAQAKWEVVIHCTPPQNQEYDQRTIGQIIGTEKDAYKEAYNIIENWKKITPNRPRIIEADVNLIDNSCPYENMNNYTYTHSLDEKFPGKFRPKWTSLKDTEN
jgi:hypothetical protein